MTDRPILFSGSMVRALLAGTKTQTRRVLKKPKWAQEKGWPERIMDEQDLDGRLSWFARDTGCLSPLPIYQPGDRLWVREAWKSDHCYDDLAPSEMGGEEALFFVADNSVERWGWKPDSLSRWGRFRQGMHMPRWASRLTLTVTDVRVQQVQEISNADAVAEGIERLNCDGLDGFRNYQSDDPKARVAMQPSFRSLWDSLNVSRGYGWDANPWVAAYTFTVERRNIDA